MGKFVILALQLIINLRSGCCQTTGPLCTPDRFYCGRDLTKLGYKNANDETLYKCTTGNIGQPFSDCHTECVTNAAESASFCKCQGSMTYCGYELIRMGWGKRPSSTLDEQELYECQNGERINFKMACPLQECMERTDGPSMCSDTSVNCTSNRKYCGYELSRMGYYDIENPHVLHGCSQNMAFIENDCYSGCTIKDDESVCDQDSKAATPSMLDKPEPTRITTTSPATPIQPQKNDHQCGYSLAQAGMTNVDAQSIYRVHSNGQLQPILRCANGCIKTSQRSFCKPTCERYQMYCGYQLNKDFEQSGNLTIAENTLYRCNNGTRPESIKHCPVRCVKGISNPFCFHGKNDAYTNVTIQEARALKQKNLDKGTGTIRFSFKPFPQSTTEFLLYIGPNLMLTVKDSDVELTGHGSAYFTKNEIKNPETRLLHFNATEQIFWISICNRQPFIKIGYGYMMDLNTLFLYGTDYQYSVRDIMAPIKYIGYNDKTASFTSDPELIRDDFVVVLDPSPVVSDKVNLLGQQGHHSVFIPAKLTPKGRELYDQIKESDAMESYLGVFDAINYSLDTEGCALNRKLKLKNSKNPFGSTDTSYIRVTLGADMYTSPGNSFVLEIWPKGHHSPIHNHGNTVGIIKLLHGSLRSIWYNPLTNESNEKPQIITQEIFHKGNITWLHPEFYQTHQLFNDRMDTAAISIQSYAYMNGDQLKDEYFNYIVPEKDKKLHKFKPNSDFEFRDFIRIIRDEHLYERCSASV